MIGGVGFFLLSTEAPTNNVTGLVVAGCLSEIVALALFIRDHNVLHRALVRYGIEAKQIFLPQDAVAAKLAELAQVLHEAETKKRNLEARIASLYTEPSEELARELYRATLSFNEVWDKYWFASDIAKGLWYVVPVRYRESLRSGVDSQVAPRSDLIMG